MKTSLWVARCLNAHENLKRWAQMAARTGDPAKDGQPIGWSPSKVVVIPEEAPLMGDVAAAIPRWNRCPKDGRRRQNISRPRQDDDLLPPAGVPVLLPPLVDGPAMHTRSKTSRFS
ncbi:unnamed protein product [Lampetra fluviatilis]